ncbi:DMT family transporter [Micromonospora phytophila]|uniref:DMT family transporter n=1 Tax=Micromonospora phytophila TaxID=709888 RepID=UPI0020303842|nr:DMT family transporter [Micromonospora phytophila]MCM0673396.1 DMT family transporter [Micromonospora phytophila]
MNSLGLSIALAVASAAAYAAAAVLQERLAASHTAEPALTFTLLAVLRRRRWWLTVALNATGALLHVAALRYGPLTVVQPLGVLTLVLALPLSAAVIRRRVTRTEWRGAAMTTTGVAGLMVLTFSAKPIEALGTPEALAIIASTAVALAALVSTAAGTRRPLSSSLLHATGSGLAFGVSSALTQTLTVHLSERGPGALLAPAGAAVTIAVVALAAAGLLLSQAAYRGGLGAPLAAATLANPAAAAAIGLAMLGEHHTTGAAGIALTLGTAAVASRGVILLATGLNRQPPEPPFPAPPAQVTSTRE